jgi:hypothetical protein
MNESLLSYNKYNALKYHGRKKYIVRRNIKVIYTHLKTGMKSSSESRFSPVSKSGTSNIFVDSIHITFTYVVSHYKLPIFQNITPLNKTEDSFISHNKKIT